MSDEQLFGQTDTIQRTGHHVKPMSDEQFFGQIHVGFKGVGILEDTGRYSSHIHSKPQNVYVKYHILTCVLLQFCCHIEHILFS